MYIFGYGSLMNGESRQRTGHTHGAIPAVATGFIRRWGKLEHSTVLSPLVVSTGQGKVNGLLLEVSKQDLGYFDQREHGYERVQIPQHQIEADASLDATKPVWIYIKNQHQLACQNVPIVQTYLDTVLAGCLEVSEHFAQQFIRYTLGWHFPIENDRNQPKYPNLARVDDKCQLIIDALLADSSN